jgi:alginate O-acetyltransferase complex protein AlgI
MLTIYLGSILMLFAALFWSSPRRARPFLILVANFVFLAWLGWLSLALYVGLFCFLNIATRWPQSRKLLALTTVIVLAPLLYFKLGRSAFGLELEVPTGLSYFTLMLLGYYFDSYRGSIEPAETVRAAASFSSFFPIAAMGPIERFKRLAPQIAAPSSWNHSRAGEAVFLIGLGLFKKFVIADRLADFVVDSPRHALQFDGPELWIFMFVSFVQIYADFSGFVDIARGYAKLLGIEVIDNFDQPYLSRNVPEIWRRWHISLVEWLRDFIYNPIALRSRNLYLATAAVMFGVGFWHDFSWRSAGWSTYWSLMYGGSILMRQRGISLKMPVPLKIALTVVAISFSTFFFLPRTLSELGRLTWNLMSASHLMEGRLFTHVALTSTDALIAGVACAFVVVFETWHRWFLRDSKPDAIKIPVFLFVAVLLLMATVALGVGDSKAFFYLRF